MVYSLSSIKKRNILTLTKSESTLKRKPIELPVKKRVSSTNQLNWQVWIIIISVYSYECPDLTLIDLPGITRISVGQQYDIEKITIEMAKRYCAEDRTIILAVIPANADMSTSQGLDLARKWDPTGQRTLGVITKIDIMDRGTDAKKMIMNQEIPLALGYVGIKNRSQ